MKVAKKRHVGPPRTTAEEARAIVSGIPVLATMLDRRRPSSAELQLMLHEAVKERTEKAGPMGLMFAARFSAAEVGPCHDPLAKRGRGGSAAQGDQAGGDNRLASDSQSSLSRSDMADFNAGGSVELGKTAAGGGGTNNNNMAAIHRSMDAVALALRETSATLTSRIDMVLFEVGRKNNAKPE
jgi:hypothetical protein